MHNQLTKKDIEDMEKEIEHRKVVLRKELLEDVKEARAQGDLSENSEYDAAKDEQRDIEARIEEIEEIIKNSEILDEKKTVTVLVEEDQSEETYKIVTTMRGNALKGLISVESPLGKQLMGHRVGDKVNIVVSNDYNYDVTILKIENTELTEEDKLKDF